MIHGKSKRILFPVLLILVTILVYLPLKNFYFFGEDFNYLAHTRYTLSLGSPLEIFYVDFYGGMWFRPLNTFFWYITWLICGLNPIYHYSVNIVILLATALLLVRFATLTKMPLHLTYMGGLLFILNPLTSATVSYLSARSDILGSFFALLALFLWLSSLDSGKNNLKYLSFLSAFFSYLFKEMFLCLPFMMMFSLTSAEGKRSKEGVTLRVKRALPFLVLALVFLLWRSYVLKSAGGYFYKRSELIYNVILIPLNILKTAFLLPKMFFAYHFQQSSGALFVIFFKVLIWAAFIFWLLVLFQRKKQEGGKTLFAWFGLSLLPVIFYPDVLRESPRLLYFPLMFFLLILLHFTATRKFLTSLFCFTFAVGWFLLGRSVIVEQLRQTEIYRSIQSAGSRDLLPHIMKGTHHQTIVAFGVPPQIYSLDLILLTTLPLDTERNNPANTAVFLLGDRSTYTGEFIMGGGSPPNERFADIFDFYFRDDVLIFKDGNTMSIHHRAPDIPRLFEAGLNPLIYNYDANENRFIEVTELFSRIADLRTEAVKSFERFGFDFGDGLDEWELNEQLLSEGRGENGLKLKSLGNDPYMVLKGIALNPKAVKSFRLKMLVKKSGTFADNITEGQILWASSIEPPFGLKKVFRFPVRADGEWHEYEIDIGRYAGWYLLDKVDTLRIDPVSCKAFIEIKSFEAVAYESGNTK